jgi:D-galactarolactone cycloisomerase
MTEHAFRIRRITARRVALDGPSYWESFVGGGAGARFLFKPGWRTVYASRVETAVVAVELDDGTVGWGEANAPIVPEVTCLLANSLLAPVLEGRHFEEPTALWDLGYDIQRGRGHLAGFHLDALAMIDVAVWDAVARRTGLPLATLLAELPRTTIPVYLSGLRQGGQDERIAAARRWADQGLTGIKIFHDHNTAGGLAELAALQDGAPAIERWMVDVLWSLPSLEAAAYAKARYHEQGAQWLECPLPPEDLDSHRQLAALPGTAVALGEHLHTRFEAAPWLTAGALQVFQPDVGRTGVSDMLRQTALAKSCDVPMTPHMGSGLDIFQAATLQVAAALGDPSLLTEFQAGLSGRLGDAVRSAWAFADGGFRLPDEPGIGIAVDEAALARFVVAEG